MEGYITSYEIKKSKDFKPYFLMKETRLERLSKEGVIEKKIINNIGYFNLEHIMDYIRELDEFWKEHIEISYVIKALFNKPNKVENREKCKVMMKELGIEIVSHKYIPLNKSRLFISKSAFENLKESYIKFNEFFELQMIFSSRRHCVEKLRRYYKNDIFRFGMRVEDIYVNKRIVGDFKSNKNKRKKYDVVDEAVISHKEAQEKLNLSKHSYYSLLKEKNIKIYYLAARNSVIKKSDLDVLLHEQKELYNFYDNNYYSYQELLDLSINYGLSKVPERVSKVGKSITPLTIKFGKFRNASKVYLKKDIDKMFNDIKNNNKLEELLNDLNLNYIELYFETLDLLGFKKNKFEMSKTLQMWFNFVQDKIIKMNKRNIDRKYRVVLLAKLTNLLDSFLMGREIENINAKEIKLALFNGELNLEKKRYYKEFIVRYNEVLIDKKLDIIKIENLDFKKNRTSKVNQEIYDVEEYKSVKKFVININLHKEKILGIFQDIETNGYSPYQDYSDMWFYTLLHIENVFRSSTITEIKSLDLDILDYFGISDLNSLFNLQINKKDCNLITNLFKQIQYLHNKNLNEGPLVCSDSLKESFTWAVIFCEYKKRKLFINNGRIINFKTKNNLPNTVIKKYFFSSCYDFKFESRKFNRTVITLINTVIKERSIDTINMAKVMRGHLSVESTNVYIKLPQEYLDELAKSLFDAGAFGYLYKKLYEGFEQKSIESEFVPNISVFKTNFEKVFGGVLKVEETFKNYLQIHRAKMVVDDQFSIMTEKDRMRLLNKLKFNTAYSKQENYFCLFDKCKYKITDECNLCPFSIVTFYEINNIIYRLNSNCVQFKNAEFGPVGERIRLYNLMLKDLENVFYFIDKYGVEIINYLNGQEIIDLMIDLQNINDPLNEVEFKE